jgi:hypothetical protein
MKRVATSARQSAKVLPDTQDAVVLRSGAPEGGARLFRPNLRGALIAHGAGKRLPASGIELADRNLMMLYL